MADNIHPVVELLAARMETHPEEFFEGYRWWEWLEDLKDVMTEEEMLLLRKAKMQRIHEEVLDELLNGEQRRAEEKAARDLEMQRLMAQSQTNAQSIYQNQAGVYQNAIGLSNRAPSQPLIINTAGQEAMRIQANGQLNIGGETLDAGMLKKMKSALGLK